MMAREPADQREFDRFTGYCVICGALGASVGALQFGVGCAIMVLGILAFCAGTVLKIADIFDKDSKL